MAMFRLGKKNEERTKASSCSCGGDCNDKKSSQSKSILIEYLYLDLNTCERCMGADEVLDEVLLTITPALRLSGYIPELKKIEISTKELAEQYQFFSSPTIRVDGIDIFGAIQENACNCCGEISGTNTDCRVFEYEGNIYEVPPKEMLAKAILKAVFSPNTIKSICPDYVLPKNLQDFFDGKAQKHEADTIEITKTDSDKRISIKVLGSGCVKCNALETAAVEALKELHIDTDIEHVTDFGRIAAYGVMTTPALVINENVASFGKVLKKEEIMQLLKDLR